MKHSTLALLVSLRLDPNLSQSFQPNSAKLKLKVNMFNYKVVIKVLIIIKTLKGKLKNQNLKLVNSDQSRHLFSCTFKIAQSCKIARPMWI